MFRRDFLKCLAAAVTGMASAARAGEIAVPSAAPRRQDAAKAPSRAGLCDAQRHVLDLIKQCTVTSVEMTQSVDSVSRHRVVYRYDGKKPQESPLASMAASIEASGAPVSMMVSSAYEPAGTHLGSLDIEGIAEDKFIREIEIEWICVGLFAKGVVA